MENGVKVSNIDTIRNSKSLSELIEDLLEIHQKFGNLPLGFDSDTLPLDGTPEDGEVTMEVRRGKIVIKDAQRGHGDANFDIWRVVASKISQDMALEIDKMILEDLTKFIEEEK